MRCPFVREPRSTVVNFLLGPLDVPRNTKTLDPPVMSLTGTRSCAASGKVLIKNEIVSKNATALVLARRIMIFLTMCVRLPRLLPMRRKRGQNILKTSNTSDFANELKGPAAHIKALVPDIVKAFRIGRFPT